MGAFGIFAAILTFIYVIYYSVMVGMDLFGNKAQKKESVEIISPTAGTVRPVEELDERPTVIAEDGMAGCEPQSENEESLEIPLETEGRISREDIETDDDNELYQQAMTAKANEMEEVESHSSIEYTTGEYEDNLTHLIKEQEACAVSLT